jgi:hypothetical protein
MVLDVLWNERKSPHQWMRSFRDSTLALIIASMSIKISQDLECAHFSTFWYCLLLLLDCSSCESGSSRQIFGIEEESFDCNNVIVSVNMDQDAGKTPFISW